MKNMKIYLKGFWAVLVMLFLATACDDYTEDYDVPEPSIVASFEVNAADDLSADDPVKFINNSVIPKRISQPSFHWDFGDGTDTVVDGYASVELDNGEVLKVFDTISHVYDTAMQFTVSLQIMVGSETSHMVDERVLIQPGGDILFEETFDDINVFPESWVLVNGDEGTVASSNPDFTNLSDSAWIVWQSGIFNSKIAVGTSWYNEEVGADDWMITPAIELGENGLLTFDALSLSTTGDYPDDYQVFVSTTTQNPAGCLDNGAELTVLAEEVGDDVGGEGIQHREVNLSAYAGQTVYIGFRLMTPYPGGDRLGIDNIKVTDL